MSHYGQTLPKLARSVAKLEKVLDGQVKLETAIDALRASIDVVVRTARETKLPVPERKDPEPKERDSQDMLLSGSVAR